MATTCLVVFGCHAVNANAAAPPGRCWLQVLAAGLVVALAALVRVGLRLARTGPCYAGGAT